MFAWIACAWLTAPLAVAHAAAPASPSSITLSGPSVVIFRASATDVAQARTERPEEYAEFRKDFDANAARFTKWLQAHPRIHVVTTTADVVRFSEPATQPVWHYSVDGGHGYLFYRPGAPVRVYAGVRSADGLICEAARTFEVKPLPGNCDPLAGR
jgi:hypothetical protein